MPGRRVLSAALTGAAAAALLAAPAGQAAQRPRATMISDSVGASLTYVPAAVRTLRRGIDLRLDLRVCRRLVDPSCPYLGVTPPTALEAVRARGAGLGRVLVVEVGYNDDPARYRAHMGQVVRAARARGVTSLVWVTLGEQRPEFVRINRVIRAAPARFAGLCVADWAAASRGRAWFGGDGLHLNTDGAMGFARLVRPYLVRATTTGSCAADARPAAPAPGAGAPPPPPPPPRAARR
jgi:hypothetical protein